MASEVDREGPFVVPRDIYLQLSYPKIRSIANAEERLERKGSRRPARAYIRHNKLGPHRSNFTLRHTRQNVDVFRLHLRTFGQL